MQKRVLSLEVQGRIGLTEDVLHIGLMKLYGKLQILQGYNFLNLETFPLVFASTSEDGTLRLDVLRDNDRRHPTVYQGPYEETTCGDKPCYAIVVDGWTCKLIIGE